MGYLVRTRRPWPTTPVRSIFLRTQTPIEAELRHGSNWAMCRTQSTTSRKRFNRGSGVGTVFTAYAFTPCKESMRRHWRTSMSASSAVRPRRSTTFRAAIIAIRYRDTIGKPSPTLNTRLRSPSSAARMPSKLQPLMNSTDWWFSRSGLRPNRIALVLRSQPVRPSSNP